MIGVLNCGLRGLGSRPAQGHCVVFSGKRLDTQRSSLHPGSINGRGRVQANCLGNQTKPHPGTVHALLMASYDDNWSYVSKVTLVY